MFNTKLIKSHMFEIKIVLIIDHQFTKLISISNNLSPLDKQTQHSWTLYVIYAYSRLAGQA